MDIAVGKIDQSWVSRDENNKLLAFTNWNSVAIQRIVDDLFYSRPLVIDIFLTSR